MAFFINKKGYPVNKATGRAVHREVAEKKIGRPLRKHEVVRHRDEDRRNFNRSNLRVMSRSHHSKLHSRYEY